MNTCVHSFSTSYYVTMYYQLVSGNLRFGETKIFNSDQVEYDTSYALPGCNYCQSFLGHHCMHNIFDNNLKIYDCAPDSWIDFI